MPYHESLRVVYGLLTTLVPSILNLNVQIPKFNLPLQSYLSAAILAMHIIILFSALLIAPLTYYWNFYADRFYIFYLILLTGLFALLKGIGTIRQSPIKIRLSELLVFILCLFLVFNQCFSGMSLSDEHFLCIMMSFLIFFTVKGNDNIKIFGTALLFLLIWQVILSIMPTFNPPYLLGPGTMNNINLFTCLVCSSLSIMPVLISELDRKITPYLIFISFLLIIILIGSGSKGSLLAGAIILGFIYGEHKSQLKQYNKLILMLFVGLLCFGVGLLFSKTESSLGRLQIWDITIKNSHRNIFKGNGLGSYVYNFPRYQYEYFQANFAGLPTVKKQLATETQVAFNEFLQFVNETGAVTALLFFAVPVYLIAFTASSGNSRYIKLLIAVLLMHSLFSYPFHSLPLLLLYMIALGMATNSTREKWYFTISKHLSIPLYAAFLVLFISSGIIAFKEHQARIKWSNVQLIKKDNETEALNVYADLYSDLKWNGNFLFEYGKYKITEMDTIGGLELLKEAQNVPTPY